MTKRVQSDIVRIACEALIVISPVTLRNWGQAIEAEFRSFPEDKGAFSFALSSLCSLALHLLKYYAYWPFVMAAGEPRGAAATDTLGTILRPRAVGLVCAVGATFFGVIYLYVAKAPTRYIWVNVGAFAVGLSILFACGRTATYVQAVKSRHGIITLCVGLIILLTSLLGTSMDGVVRWVGFGAILVQPSFILLPLAVIGYSCSQDSFSMAGLVISAIALALQPDAAMACVLAAGCTVVFATRPNWRTMLTFGASIAGFLVSVLRVDTLPAAQYVEGVLRSAFSTHIVMGLAVLAGLALLVTPAVLGVAFDRLRADTYLAFGAVWTTALTASVFGNYPTPVVGYGASAIIGYVLSVCALPRIARISEIDEGHGLDTEHVPETDDPTLCLGPTTSS